MAVEWVLPMMVGLCLMAGAAVVVACYALHRALNAEIQVKALQSSTHQIQMVPFDPMSTADAAVEREVNADFERAERAAMRRVHEIHEESEPLM